MRTKFKYDKHHIVFYFEFKGKQVEVLRATLRDGTLSEIKRLQFLANESMIELYNALRKVA